MPLPHPSLCLPTHRRGRLKDGVFSSANAGDAIDDVDRLMTSTSVCCVLVDFVARKCSTLTECVLCGGEGGGGMGGVGIKGGVSVTRTEEVHESRPLTFDSLRLNFPIIICRRRSVDPKVTSGVD